MTLLKKRGTRVPLLSAAEAAGLIPGGATVAIVGAGGGITEPTELINALVERFDKSGEPRGLSFWHATGLGDRDNRGMSPLARPGLVKRSTGGHWGQSPRLAEMAERDEIEAYCIPQGVMSQLLRCAAAGQPGLLTHVGLGTCVDPRQGGGKLNGITTEDIVRVMELDGEEWLYYKAPKIDVALIRGTTADADGYISMEDEIAYLDALQMAQAAHNSGGLVLAQVGRVVRAASLHPRTIRIPGYLVDVMVVNPEQKQLYSTYANRFMSGDYAALDEETAPLRVDERKVIVRRALMETRPACVGNVGVGIADGIGAVAREEDIADDFTLTIETGPIGGVTEQGIFFGASINSRALLDMPAQFDFYGGGGLDVCFLSFAEIDPSGNVNVSRFNNKIQGLGGFADISSKSKKLVFCGTLTAGGLRTEVADGEIKIIQEGRFQKFLSKVEEISFSGVEAVKKGLEVLYLTERAVFRLSKRGVELCEIAPGMEIDKDILPFMGFRPLIAMPPKRMDARLFAAGKMGIATEWREGR